MKFNFSNTLSFVLPIVIATEIFLLIAYLLTQENQIYLYFSHTYNFIGLIGTLLTFYAATFWGSNKSSLGKALLFIGSGQLFLFLGQNMCTFIRIYNQLDKCPYPSYAEIFFAGSIFLYIFGAFYLGLSMGVLRAIRSRLGYKALAVLTAAFMIWFALYKFTQVNELVTLEDFTNLVKDNGYIYLLLELIYPFGAGIYTLFAIIAAFGSVDISGGKLIKGCILVLLGFFMQFSGDTAYIWTSGLISDILYFTSFIMMALAGFSFVSAVEEIKQTAKNSYLKHNGGQ